jgi:thiol-disulfide isomerase/thioredoxin
MKMKNKHVLLSLYFILLISFCFTHLSFSQQSCMLHDFINYNMKLKDESYQYVIVQKWLNRDDTTRNTGQVVLNEFNPKSKKQGMSYFLKDSTFNFSFSLANHEAIYQNYSNLQFQILKGKKEIRKFINGNSVIGKAIFWHDGLINNVLSKDGACKKLSKSGYLLSEPSEFNDTILFEISSPRKNFLIGNVKYVLAFNINTKKIISYSSELTDRFGRTQYIKISYNWDCKFTKAKENVFSGFDYRGMSVGDIELFNIGKGITEPILQNTQGKKVLIYIWHSGCGPCIKTLQRVNSEHLDIINKRNVIFIAINPFEFDSIKGVSSSAKKIDNSLGNPWWSYYAISEFKPLGKKSTPQFFLYDANFKFLKEGHKAISKIL